MDELVTIAPTQESVDELKAMDPLDLKGWQPRLAPGCDINTDTN